MTTTHVIYKGHNSPFLVEITDVEGDIYKTADMQGITRVYLKYISATGATPEYVDSDEASHSDVFDWTTYESSGKLYIDLGLIGLTAGRDLTAELIIYDADYTSGRVVSQLDLKVSEEATGTASLADTIVLIGAFSSPVDYTDNHTVTASEFFKTLRMTATESKTFTLPSAGEDEDGKRLTFMILGTGDLVIQCSDSDTIATGAHTKLTGTTQYGSITIEYVHAITAWIVLSDTGSWSSS